MKGPLAVGQRKALVLPDIQGSDQVRNLREAASLDTEVGHAFVALLIQFSQVTTYTGAYAGYETVDTQAWFSGPGFNFCDADYVTWSKKLSIMERFNRRTYQPVDERRKVALWKTNDARWGNAI